MLTKRWIDVDPLDWFYRSVLEADRIYLDPNKEETLFSGKLYNKFISGKERKVVNFTTVEGQTKFKISGYKPHPDELVYVIIDGVLTSPSKLENDWVHVGQPLAGGLKVTVFLSGVPEMLTGDPMKNDAANCIITPLINSCTPAYPSAKLEKQKDYVFDLRYFYNEYCVCLGKKLQRVNVTVKSEEPIQAALQRTIGYKRDCYTIIDGYLYVSYNLNGFPCLVNYNYKSKGVVKNRQNEPVTPKSSCAVYNDRFFPDITLTRAEFFVLLQRMRKNFYNRYTDREYVPNTVNNTERYISDRDQIVGKWYAEDVLDILDEKFLDGCYVFPLYEDDTFAPDVCVTRAEAVVYLHRFIEWALERFR